MSYVNVYPTRINWENEPSINTPINETNLNKMDYALYEHDQTLANWDTTKANQSDLLLCVKTITYDTDTGEFVFTWQNGTTQTIDLNIEKIPVSFSMNAQGVITMTTEDGTQYTADVGSLIKTYTFTDSTVIDFTVTTDADGNKTVTAGIVDGSITGTKLQPNYLADCTAAKTAAELAETGAEGSAEDSEAWAVGTRSGVPVPATDPTYNNNAKYWAEQAPSNSLATLTDTDINTPTDGQVLTYDNSSQKWVNADQAAGGGSKIVLTTSELSLIGQTATLTDGVTTLSAEIDNSGKATFEGVTITGNLTASASDGVNTATASLTVPYFGNYTAALSFFSATVTVTFPYSLGATCTLSDGVTTLTANTSPMAFSIPNTGTWTATCTLDGVAKTQNFVITTDGQTESHTFSYGTINLTFSNEFRGLNLTCTDGNTTITKTAPIAGNTMSFYPPNTGTWTISGIYSGVTYSTGNITVSSLSTAVSATLQTIPNGSTVTPTDNVQKLLNCAGIFDKNYTTIAQLLADSTSLLTVISSNNAVDYLVRSTTFASSVCANSTAMTDIGANDYCATTLLGDATWCTTICNSTYFESVLNKKVPTMTSATTPSGEVFQSDNYDASMVGWHAFDGVTNNNSNAWHSTNTPPHYIGFDFTNAVTIYRVDITSDGRVTDGNITFKMQGSSNKTSSYTDSSSNLAINGMGIIGTVHKFVFANTNKKRYHRLYTASGYTNSSNGYCTIQELQFYGR